MLNELNEYLDISEYHDIKANYNKWLHLDYHGTTSLLFSFVLKYDFMQHHCIHISILKWDIFV